MNNKIVEQVAQLLNSSLNNVTPTNVQANRGIWDSYAEKWSQDASFVKKMASDVNKMEV